MIVEHPKQKWEFIASSIRLKETESYTTEMEYEGKRGLGITKV